VERGAAFFKKGWLISSDIVALLSTSTSRHRDKKSLNSADMFSGCLSFGVPLVAIRYNAWDKDHEFFGVRFGLVFLFYWLV